MALFQRKQAEGKKVETKPVSGMVHDTTNTGAGADVLRNPRITEKATSHMETGVYTFDVSPTATKRSIARAISSLYKVTPRKIRVVTIHAKTRRNARTGQRGATRGGKKAYVYLKKGENITIS